MLIFQMVVWDVHHSSVIIFGDMDIVSRLKQFLQQNGIANSLFADTCDIPRPTLSQLLNGRNKKVSDEVIAKIHRAYPSLNILWLMFGDGDMYVPNANNATPQSPSNPITDATHEQAGHPTISFGGEGDFKATQGAGRQIGARSQQAFNDAIETIVRRTGARQAQSQPHNAAEGRRVVSIMVLYNDGRFETFTPQ